MKKTILITFVVYITATENVLAQTPWFITGNAGTNTSTNFIGTTDNKPLKFRTNNNVRMQITGSGKVSIGNFTPVFKLDVKGGSINTDSVYRIGGNTVLTVAGIGNTFIGITNNTTNIGSSNTAIGNNALYSNITGTNNTATGSGALKANTSGQQNTATGFASLGSNISGSFNIATGIRALFYNTSGSYNIAIGNNSLEYNVATSNNTVVGYGAMYYANNSLNAIETNNTAIGYKALQGAVSLSNTGTLNTAVGAQSLYSNASGYYNTACGYQALFSNSTGFDNVANGMYALYYNTSGHSNTANGMQALFYNTSGAYNTAAGRDAGNNNGTSPSNFTALGYNAGHVGSNTNTIEIGNSSISYIGGQVLWDAWSDRRIKDNIQSNVPGLSFITKLNPVTYNFNIHRQNEICGINDTNEWEGKYDIEKIVQTGLIAQEVEQAAKECEFNFNGVSAPYGNGKLYSLKYAAFVVPLIKAVQELDEKYQKSEVRNQKLEEENENLKNDIAEIKAALGLKTKTSDFQLPASGFLEQNAPNPFNSQTEIKFQLPSTFSSAQLIITDANAKQVRNNVLKASSSVIIKASELAAGTYSYSLVIDGVTIDSKQMVLTK